jgi:hypothetical protein
MVEHALRVGGTHSDNVTVLAMEWEAPDVFESTRRVSTDSIMDGVFASTWIQAGGLDTVVDDLDEGSHRALDRRDQQKPFAVLPLQV